MGGGAKQSSVGTCVTNTASDRPVSSLLSLCLLFSISDVTDTFLSIHASRGSYKRRAGGGGIWLHLLGGVPYTDTLLVECPPITCDIYLHRTLVILDD